MAIQLLQTTRNFCNQQSHLLSEQIFNVDVACITFSESVMSKCLSLSQLTSTALIFLLCQQQSFSLGSNPCTADSVSQQKTKSGAWASIPVMQLIFFFFSPTMAMAYFLLLNLVYCHLRRMYGTFLHIPYGNILPVYYSISSHTFYFL